jgi:hypothetical protein
MRLGVVYKLSIGKYFIIGSSINFKTRKYNYSNSLKLNKWTNRIVQNVYNKHLNEKLKFTILQKDIPENILEFIEDIWIGSCCSRVEDKKGGMNCRDAHRVRFTQEIKDKMSKSMQGRIFSQETKNKLSVISLGIKKSDSHKQNISKGKKGVKFSEEHKNKLSLSHKGKIPWNKGSKIKPKSSK